MDMNAVTDGACRAAWPRQSTRYFGENCASRGPAKISCLRNPHPAWPCAWAPSPKDFGQFGHAVGHWQWAPAARDQARQHRSQTVLLVEAVFERGAVARHVLRP